jgi:hypothetical protein
LKIRHALAGVVLAGCLITACSRDSSSLALTNASVDQTYTCPAGANNAAYELHATVDAHNGTSGAITIKSVTATMTLEAIKGTWLDKVGDKYQAVNATVTPTTVAAGANSSLKLTIPSACTNGKVMNGASYGDYRVNLQLATSAGNYAISSKTVHRIVAA